MDRLKHLEILAHAQEVARAGIPLDARWIGLEIGDMPPGVQITQASDLIASRISPLECGPTALNLDLEIVSNLPGILTVYDFRLEFPWPTEPITWLPDPAEDVPPEKFYSFASHPSFVFPRASAINHLFRKKKFRRGDLLSGLLLGQSRTPVPERFAHGQTLSAKLSLVDTIGRCFSGDFRLFLDRSDQLAQRPRLAAARDRRPLFSGSLGVNQTLGEPLHQTEPEEADERYELKFSSRTEK